LNGELVVLIAIKFVALALLWWLFFSPAHRTVVDADSASHRLGMAGTSASKPLPPMPVHAREVPP